MENDIRRLARRLSIRMICRAVYCNGILLAPFLAFIVFAAGNVQFQAMAVCFAVYLPILWLCTWDFVRISVKRRSFAFCTVWLKVLPQEDAPPSPRPSLRIPVNALFMPRLKAFLTAALIMAAPLCFELTRNHSFWTLLLLPVPWMLAETRLLAQLLRDRIGEEPSLAAAAGRALNQKRGVRGVLGAFGYFARDFAVWSWLIAPAWVYAVMVIPGAIPRPPGPEALAFFSAAPHVPRDDGSYALAGLDAPANVRDTTAFGKEKLQWNLAPPPPAFADASGLLKGVPQSLQGFYICPGKMPPPPQAEAPAPIAPPNCLSIKEWGPILAANREMLDRYEGLFRYSDFEMPVPTEEAVPGLLLRDLSRLDAIAYAYQAYSGDPEAALQGWLRDARFLRRLMETPATMSGFLVNQSVYLPAFRYLPYILSKRAGLASKYKDDIESTLVFLKPGGYDYKKIWDRTARSLPVIMELAVRQPPHLAPVAWAVNINIFENALYGLTQEVHAALDVKEPAAMDKALDDISRRHDPAVRFRRLGDMASMWQTMTFSALVSGVARDPFLAFGTVTPMDKQRIVFAWLEETAAGISPGGLDAFLKNAPPGGPLREVASGRAFDADPRTGAVCFPFAIYVQSYTPLFEEPEPGCYGAVPLVEAEKALK